MSVLCVDPAEDDRRETQSALRDAGFDVTACGTLSDARDALDTESVVGVVTEYDLPDGTGLDLVEQARDIVPDVTCVLFTDTELDEIDTASLDTVVEYVDRTAPNAHDELVDLLQFSIDTGSQTAYPLPENEGDRLAAVEEYVVDTDAFDAALSRLTTIATALFDVDAASVGFIEAHHEQFVACQGIDIDRIDREDTICTYTILDDGTTVVPDTRDDPRFNDNEAIDTTEIRFYAGAPVTTADGEAIGVFCLYDDEPRTFSARDRELLSMLADEVMEQLDLRRRLRGGEGDE